MDEVPGGHRDIHEYGMYPLALGLSDSPSVVIFRLRDETPASVNPRLLEVLKERGKELESGALIVVEDNRYRMRRLPIEE